MSKHAEFNMKFRIMVFVSLVAALLLVAATMSASLFAVKASAEQGTYVPATVTVAEVQRPVVAQDVPVVQPKVAVVTTAAPVVEEAVAPVAEVAPVVVAAPVAKTAKAAPAKVEAHVCQEDEDCWDCKTMGNKICGTPEVAIGGTTEQHKNQEQYTPKPANCTDIRCILPVEGRAIFEAYYAPSKSFEGTYNGWFLAGDVSKYFDVEHVTVIESAEVPGYVHVFNACPTKVRAEGCMYTQG